MISHSYLAETQSTCLATRTTDRFQNYGQSATTVGHLDRQSLDARCATPDVAARQTGELASPTASERQTTQDGQELVATVERPVETDVADFPDAVDRSDPIGFTENLFEMNLNRASEQTEIAKQVRSVLCIGLIKTTRSYT